MRTSETQKEIYPALIKVQSEIQNVLNTSSNPFYKSKYAPLDEILNYIRPVITKHGLAIVQSPVSIADVPVSVGVTTRIMHSSGEWIEDTISVPIPHNKPNTAQEAGIIITYLRRYSVTAFLGIAGEADTDGNRHEDKPEPKKEESKLLTKPEQAKEAIQRVDTKIKCDQLVEWINKTFTDVIVRDGLLFELDEHTQKMKIGE